MHLWLLGGSNSQGVWEGHVDTVMFKTDNQQGPTVQRMDLYLGEQWGSGRMDTCICVAESLHSSPETTTTLLIGYTPNTKQKVLKCEKTNPDQKSNICLQVDVCPICLNYEAPHQGWQAEQRLLKHILVQIPETTIHEGRDFADMIKLRRWQDEPGLYRCLQCSQKFLSGGRRLVIRGEI